MYELDDNSQCFLKDLFGNVIDTDEKIVAWKNKMVQKSDMFIKYKNHIKGISLKCGNSNSVHHEQIQDFKRYLEKIGIPYKSIDEYVWIKKYDFYDLILSKRCLDYTSPHIACLIIGPKKRNLDGNSKNVKDRYLVCIRWNFIRENIIDFKKNHVKQ